MINGYLLPIQGIVAFGTILAVSALMRVIFLVTLVTSLGRSLKLRDTLSSPMALHAILRTMFSRKLKSCGIVVPRLSVGIDTIVTLQASGPERIQVSPGKNGVDIAVTVVAQLFIELAHAALMTIKTGERLPVRPGLMGLERISQVI